MSRSVWFGGQDWVGPHRVVGRLVLGHTEPDSGVVGVDRIPLCPNCGKVDRLQYRLVGMPPAPPQGFDESTVIFSGCVISGDPEPSFRCARCSIDFDPPGYPEAESWEFQDSEADR